MYETIKEAPDFKKEDAVDLEIEEILNRIKTLAETGWASIKANRFSRMAIIPISCAIRENLAELEDFVLEHQEGSTDPDLREKIGWLRSVSAQKKANDS
jgi:hypothetical protein